MTPDQKLERQKNAESGKLDTISQADLSRIECVTRQTINSKVDRGVYEGVNVYGKQRVVIETLPKHIKALIEEAQHGQA